MTTLIDLDAWEQVIPDIAERCYIPTNEEIANASYAILPEITLIGDQTANTLVIPLGNTDILSYTIGDPTDKDHLNPKTLQINAPCEYI